jgi:hypothetical protein
MSVQSVAGCLLLQIQQASASSFPVVGEFVRMREDGVGNEEGGGGWLRVPFGEGGKMVLAGCVPELRVCNPPALHERS